jgi:hypothetical protein
MGLRKHHDDRAGDVYYSVSWTVFSRKNTAVPAPVLL